MQSIKFRNATASFVLLAVGGTLSACADMSKVASPITGLFSKSASPKPQDKTPAPDFLAQGDAARDQGDFQTAADDYVKAAAANPNSLDAELRLGNAEMALNDNDAATAAFKAAQNLSLVDSEAAFRLGEIALMKGDAAGALDQFAVAEENRKDDPKLYNVMGVAQGIEGHDDLARQSYEQGLKLDPNDSALRNNYGLMQLSTGDLAGALATFSALVELPQASDRYRVNLALVETALGRIDDAKAETGGTMDEAALRDALAAYYRPPAPPAQPAAVPIKGKKTAKATKAALAKLTPAAKPEPLAPGAPPAVHFALGSGTPAAADSAPATKPVADLPATPAGN